MISLAITLLLWAIVAVLALVAASRSRLAFREGARSGAVEFLYLLPRLCIGVVGSGYIAAALPQEFVSQWLGPESGPLGIAIATLAGALTPGGPVVGFSIGAAALKGGAGAPQVIAYSTAWALFAFPAADRLRIADDAGARGVAARAGVAADPAARRRRRDADRPALIARCQCTADAARGMMAPRWWIFSAASLCAAATAASGAAPDSRAAR